MAQRPKHKHEVVLDGTCMQLKLKTGRARSHVAQLPAGTVAEQLPRGAAGSPRRRYPALTVLPGQGLDRRTQRFLPAAASLRFSMVLPSAPQHHLRSAPLSEASTAFLVSRSDVICPPAHAETPARRAAAAQRRTALRCSSGPAGPAPPRAPPRQGAATAPRPAEPGAAARSPAAPRPSAPLEDGVGRPSRSAAAAARRPRDLPPARRPHR